MPFKNGIKDKKYRNQPKLRRRKPSMIEDFVRFVGVQKLEELPRGGHVFSGDDGGGEVRFVIMGELADRMDIDHAFALEEFQEIRIVADENIRRLAVLDFLFLLDRLAVHGGDAHGVLPDEGGDDLRQGDHQTVIAQNRDRIDFLLLRGCDGGKPERKANYHNHSILMNTEKNLTRCSGYAPH